MQSAAPFRPWRDQSRAPASGECHRTVYSGRPDLMEGHRDVRHCWDLGSRSGHWTIGRIAQAPGISRLRFSRPCNFGKWPSREATRRRQVEELGKPAVGEADHGRPNEPNAHPHATDVVAVVHNGIIENFRELREELEGKGAKFSTE